MWELWQSAITGSRSRNSGCRCRRIVALSLYPGMILTRIPICSSCSTVIPILAIGMPQKVGKEFGTGNIGQHFDMAIVEASFGGGSLEQFFGNGILAAAPSSSSSPSAGRHFVRYKRIIYSQLRQTIYSPHTVVWSNSWSSEEYWRGSQKTIVIVGVVENKNWVDPILPVMTEVRSLLKYL